MNFFSWAWLVKGCVTTTTSDMSHLPEAVLCEIFSYLSVRDLCACCCVCGRWADVLYPSSHFWEERLSIETPDEFREDPFIRNLVTAKDKLAAYQNSWCAIHHSDNIYIKPNKVTIHRKPVAQFSDVARGRRGCSSGQHYWTVVWHGPKFGSSAVVGLATHNVELKCDGYHPLLGMSGDSWGWDLSKSVLRHDGKEYEEYPREGSGVKVRGGILGVHNIIHCNTVEPLYSGHPWEIF